MGERESMGLLARPTLSDRQQRQLCRRSEYTRCAQYAQ
ncbi:Uncharacterised protein [Vibrio cholerae]|nr:Uncharacterised protein [Vibrio cholerae]